MTTKCVVYARSDGGVSIIIPANRYVAEIEAAAAKLGQSFTPEQLVIMACDKALSADIQGTAPLVCDRADLPTDRTFRNAWERDVATPIKTNMLKALDIAKNKIRSEREPLFTPLDAEFLRALETNDTTKQAEIVARKQKLRDATADPRLAAADPAALKTAMDAVIAEMKM